MNPKNYAVLAGLLAGGLLTTSSTPAQAFSFTTNLGAGSNAPKGDIWLDSVQLTDGTIVNNFSLVERAQILHNDLHTGGNTGAASSDIGDRASGVKAEVATPESIVASLGNTNLNNIIDTEDRGSFKINLFFESAVDMLFFWERGMNSKLGVQAIDSNGSLLGNFLELDSKFWSYAGYGIDTKEIGGTQRVGSKGLTLADLGVSGPIAGIQVTSKGASYNGPDFKVAGSAASVPEPATMAGIGLVAGVMAMSRRRKSAQNA